jgi:hypothetical protein
MIFSNLKYTHKMVSSQQIIVGMWTTHATNRYIIHLICELQRTGQFLAANNLYRTAMQTGRRDVMLFLEKHVPYLQNRSVACRLDSHNANIVSTL